MKKLALSMALVVVLGSSAFAQQGSIGLYLDEGGQDCDVTFGIFVEQDMFVVYDREGKTPFGPNGITGAEFKLEFDDAVVELDGWNWQAFGANVRVGDPASGIALGWPSCHGPGSRYVPLMTVTFICEDVPPSQFTIRVVESPKVNPQIGYPIVSDCALIGREEHAVWGGWFYHPEGTCNVSTVSSSWGAIKELYRR